MALQNCSIWPMKTFLTDTYYIPDYQREYSWEENEWGDFWDDLEFTQNDPVKAQHFFGQVVVHNDCEAKEPQKYIIDGQQRTVTSVIFLRAMRQFVDEIYSATQDDEAGDILDEIKQCVGNATKTNKLHLVIGEQDREYFQESIQKSYPNETVVQKKKSRERMRKAFFFFHKKLQEVLENCGTDTQNRIECLADYYDAFAKRFNILYMEATKLDEAFAIFETLNARGKDLETADLLKNYIFRESKDITWCQKTWNNMMTTLDGADPTKYIRYFWNSRYNFVRDKELYRKIGKEQDFQGPRGCKTLLSLLDKYAPYYHAMTAPDDDATFQSGVLLQSLRTLKTLKARSFYPIILAMEQTEEFGKDEKALEIVVGQIERFVFCNLTICGKATGQIERLFAEIARKIYNGELDNTDAICAKMREQMVTNEEFQSAFSVWSASKSEKEIVRYIFTQIHKLLDKNMEIDLDSSKVHVEHIMPVDTSQWSVDEETHETYLWRLGNLMLLSGSINISISNKPFSEKKGRYADSKIEPNKEVSELNQWGTAEIEERQKRLCALALQIWKK